jgi:YEATS domain-containing protein 4
VIPASKEDASTPAPSAAQTAAAASSGVSTRGREHETDYHKMVGGKDDISHFIKRVQFKLHETYAQSTRSKYLEISGSS